jgi:TPR repeat protein
MRLQRKIKRQPLLFCMALGLPLWISGVWAQPTNAASPQSNGIDPIELAKAKAGNADAEYRIAVSYAKLGNLKESHRWHLMAAQNGNVRAMTIVAADYELGRNVPQDYDQALKWYRQAAELGDAMAQFNIGVSNYKGEGVPQDYAEAYFWLDLSTSGDLGSNFMQEAARKLRDEVASNLTKTLLLQTQERARKWFEAHPAKTQ